MSTGWLNIFKALWHKVNKCQLHNEKAQCCAFATRFGSDVKSNHYYSRKWSFIDILFLTYHKKWKMEILDGPGHPPDTVQVKHICQAQHFNCLIYFILVLNCQQWNVRLGTEKKRPGKTLKNNVMINGVETDNKSQWINSKNNAWDLATIKLCEVICCEAITFHSTSDSLSKWPALLIQDTFITSGAKKSVSMPLEGDFC